MARNKKKLDAKEIATFEKMEMWEISQLIQTGIALKLIDWETVTNTLEWLACKPCKKCATIPRTPPPTEDRCLCGGVGCNSCEPQGRGCNHGLTRNDCNRRL